MPQFDPSTWTSQIFWLVVTFCLLYVLMARIILPRMSGILDEREKQVSTNLKKAEQLKQDAEKVLADYEHTMQDAHTRASALLKSAADDIAIRVAERHAALDKELNEKLRDAEERINFARREALKETGPLKEIAQNVATLATECLLGAEDIPADFISGAVARALEKREIR